MDRCASRAGDYDIPGYDADLGMTGRRAIRGDTAVSYAWLLTLLLIAAGAVTTVGR